MQKRLYELTNKFGGPSKCGSGCLTVEYGPNGIWVEVGGYDFPGCDRHHRLGNFQTEMDAQQAVIDLIIRLDGEPADDEGDWE